MLVNAKALNEKLKTEELVSEAKSGDRIAMNLLLERWYPRIYHFVLRNVFDRNDAKEISQKTMSSVFKNIKGLRDASKFKYWIYRIARNNCNSYHKNPRKVFSLEDADVYTMVSKEESVEDTLVNQERRTIVIEALRKIPSKQREVVVLKMYENLKFHEIATILEISENTAKSRMYYGLDALKKRLISNPSIKETYL